MCKTYYIDNYTLIKKIKDYLSEWRDLTCLCLRRLSVFKMTILHKLICSEILIYNSQQTFFCRN